MEREAGNLRRSHATLVSLLGYDPVQRALASPALTASPRIAYAVAKQLWAADVPALALRQLTQLEQILVDQRQRARRLLAQTKDKACGPLLSPNRSLLLLLVTSLTLRLGAEWVECAGGRA